MQAGAIIKLYSHLQGFRLNHMRSPKFWPLDFDPEGAIYENPSWDLPGFKRGLLARPNTGSSLPRKTTRAGSR
jgi:hypothetical protein